MESHSPEETQAIGERLGTLLRAGDVVLLSGELGSGKTCLTQGLAKGLDIGDIVCSPTFVLVGEYTGRERLYHADLYRLDDPAEVEALELDRSTEDGVLVVEWPERAPQFLPEQHLLVQLTFGGDGRRLIDFQARGRRAAEIADSLLDRLAASV